jgi:hypothetical protein
MQKILFILVASIFAIANIAHAANKNEQAASTSSSKKIVTWVDSKGVTQYGDKLPAQEAGRNNSIMNSQGRVLKQNHAGNLQNEMLDQQKLEKERKDKILLASYTNAEEIDLARDRNLQMDQAALQALTQQKISTADRTARNNKTAEGFRKRKKPIPSYLSDELRISKLEATNIDKQLVQRKLSMEATKARYAEEKARFIALKQPIPDDSHAAANEPVPTVSSSSNEITSAKVPSPINAAAKTAPTKTK